ncbi:Bifunctional phosphopantothenoylcysteine decarboxylase/phosphopantothenate synthase, partial [Pseudomonas congelans]
MGTAVPVRSLCYLSPSFLHDDLAWGGVMAVVCSLDQKGRSMQRLYRKRIVLGVGGGIAA